MFLPAVTFSRILPSIDLSIRSLALTSISRIVLVLLMLLLLLLIVRLAIRLIIAVDRLAICDFSILITAGMITIWLTRLLRIVPIIVRLLLLVTIVVVPPSITRPPILLRLSLILTTRWLRLRALIVVVVCHANKLRSRLASARICPSKCRANHDGQPRVRSNTGMRSYLVRTFQPYALKTELVMKSGRSECNEPSTQVSQLTCCRWTLKLTGDTSFKQNLHWRMTPTNGRFESVLTVACFEHAGE